MEKTIWITCFYFLLSLQFGMLVAGNRESNTQEQNNIVPEWAKKVVWYQIFPERFRNGDASNDPKLENLKGSYPYDAESEWQIHPWTSDWYKLQPWEKKTGKDIWFNISRRRYGGDLQGIIDKLDYVKELGVSAIYLNPIFESPSLHKYDGVTYHHVDPNFGPDPDGDRKIIASEKFNDPSTWQWTSADKLFLELVKKVHEKNMYIIIDGVFNHMGVNSFAFQDVKKNQQNSEYKNWFTIKKWDNPETGDKFDYVGWFGVRDLPEIKEDENGIVEEPKNYIFAATQRWMDPYKNGDTKSGIDGWRLDVAFCVKHGFWKDWRKHVKSINPDAYLTGEVFVDSLKEFKDYLSGDEFDAVMNYPYLYTCSEYFVDKNNKISTTKFDQLLRELREMFPADISYVQQNLFDSHDTQRLSSHIVNRNIGPYRNWGEFFNKTKGGNPAYNTRKPNANEIQLQKLMVLFQMTYVGAPMVYYGDEAGMWGANDPCPRKPMVWKEMNYEKESVLPSQKKRKTADEVKFNDDLFGYYKKMIAIRNSHPALQLGEFKTLLADDKNNIYAFERSSADEKVVVVLNNNSSAKSVDLDLNGTSYKDIMNGEKSYKLKNGKLKIKLNPLSGSILVME